MTEPFDNWVVQIEGFLIVLNRYLEWAPENFDRLAEVWGFDPDDDRLISTLIDRGWMYSVGSRQYVRVDVPDWEGSRFDRDDVV